MSRSIPPQHILVIDDDSSVQNTLRLVLTFERNTVELAINGREALEKLDKHKFDVVFTDLKMQGMLGDALVRAIKKDYPQQVVLMVTAYGDVLSPLQKLSIPVDSLISKPFSIRTLRNALRRAHELNENSQKAATSPPLADPAAVSGVIGKKKAAHF